MERWPVFDDLEFVRARLNTLAQRRTKRGLTAVESDEYRDLCLRELSLLARHPLPTSPRSARRRRPPRA